MAALVCCGAAIAAAPAPRLLLTADDFARIQRQSTTQPWAAALVEGVVRTAKAWPAPYLSRFGYTQWQLPADGGQWTLWYVCPVHGVSLKMKAPGQNICPVDNKNFTGWPYDQVIYSYAHSDNASAARDNALAYRFSGDRKYADAAAKILLAYAGRYLTYPIKDVNNKLNATSGARVMAQTLDEAIWLIPMAWAYDLIYDTLSPADRANIEQNLLRQAAAVIQRNDAKASNWQSWHNAAIGAVGFTLDDQALSAKAIDGASGFRFQMRSSVEPDGAWYEGAWGYHFFALDPLCQLAEMASNAGIDLYSSGPLRKMFEAPVRMSLPDWTLPPFNDSGNVSILSYTRLFEMAYARYQDPRFAAVVSRKPRTREGLFWGAETVPAGAAPPQPSAIFPDSGNAILRDATTDHYLAFKFGPHGGGHGHYDKLNFMTYWRGGVMAVDPGTQSYAAPTHTTWDKVTLAHNTVSVDESTQAEATGKLLASATLPNVSAVRADAGPVYKQASLQRTLIFTGDYIVDAFTAAALDGKAHKFDWAYHNYGETSTALDLKPYSGFPSTGVYRNLTATRGAATEAAWQASFDLDATRDWSLGNPYLSATGIVATFETSREQAYSGLFSGRMTYDFSKAGGYTLYTVPLTAAQVPQSISLLFYGDSSGNSLSLRINDATDERFVCAIGKIDWTGWRQITAPDPGKCTHYLGNDDGIVDLPVKSFTVELDHAVDGALKGTLYMDDLMIDDALVNDFEIALRKLQVTMLGAPNTTVVLGNGLGPDLLKPVPFAMARRQAISTDFVALLEPYGDRPAISTFETQFGGGFHVSTSAWEDSIVFTTAGELLYTRYANGMPVRAAIANASTLDKLIQLAGPGSVQVDYRDGDVLISGELPKGDTRIWAPNAMRVLLNGTPVEFEIVDGVVLLH